MTRLGIRFWVESTLAVTSCALLLLTLFSRSWIERVFLIDPDGGGGALEWIVVGCVLVGTVASVTLATREWRRHTTVGVA